VRLDDAVDPQAVIGLVLLDGVLLAVAEQARRALGAGQIEGACLLKEGFGLGYVDLAVDVIKADTGASFGPGVSALVEQCAVFPCVADAVHLGIGGEALVEGVIPVFALPRPRAVAACLGRVEFQVVGVVFEQHAVEGLGFIDEGQVYFSRCDN